MPRTFALALTLAGCSSGPQLPISTVPQNITITFTATDGGMIEDCDVMLDRSGAGSQQDTLGNRTTTGDITPSVSVATP